MAPIELPTGLPGRVPGRIATVLGAAVLLWGAALAGLATERVSPGTVALVGTVLLGGIAACATFSEVKRARLAANADLLWQILDRLPANLQIKDTEGRYLWYNKSFGESRRRHGTDPELLLGKTISEVSFNPNLAAAVVAHDRAVLERSDGGVPREQIFSGKDGNPNLVVMVTKWPLLVSGTPVALATFSDDSEEWRQQQAYYEEVRQLLETVMEEAPVTLQVVDRNMCLRWANKAFRHYFDLNDRPILGKHISEFRRSDDMVDHTVDTNRRIFATGEAPDEFEQILIGADGRDDTHLLVKKVPIRDADGTVGKILTIGTDITALRRADSRFAAADSLLSSILKHAPISIQAKDRDLRIVWANERFGVAAGRSPQELTGKTLRDLALPPEAIERTEAVDRSILNNGGTVEYTERWIIDGQRRHILTIKAPMSDPEGQRTHVVTFGVDVSAERRLLDEIESTRALLQSVLDVVPVSITLKGQDLRFRLVNRMHEQWLGLPEGTAVGQTVHELFPLEPWCDTIAEQDRQFLAGESNGATTELDIAPSPSEARSVQVRRTAVRNNRGELEGVLSVGIDVTDINRANRELKQLTAELEQRVRERTSELEETGRFLSAVLTGAPGPIVVWGPEGGIRSFNPAAAELTGCADAEALAARLSDASNPGKVAFDRMWAEAAAGRSVEGQELVFRRADGSTVFFAVASAPLTGANGEIEGMVSNWLDITDRRLAEAEMRRWYEAFQQAGVGLVLTQGRAPDNFIVSANAEFERLYRIGPGSAVGQTPASFYALGGSEIIRKAIDDVENKGRAIYDARMLRRDGTEFDAAISVAAVALTGETRPTRITTVTDITYRRHLEAERDRWADAISHAAFGIAIVDAETDVCLAANPAYARMCDQSPDTIVGQPIRRHVAEDSQAIYDEMLRDADRGVVSTGVTAYSRADGKRLPVRNWLTTVRDSTGKRVYRICSAFDISEQQRVEEELRRAHKMEAIGLLTGGIAHDFNNMLSIILGNLDTLHDRADSDRDTADMLEDALEAATKAADLCRNLLAFASRQALEPQCIDVAAALNETGRLLSRVLGEQIHCQTEAADDLWPVVIDPTQFESALVNLALNARDAMPRGGQLRISARNETMRNRRGRGGLAIPPGDYVAISVADTGIGMAPDVADRAFDPFFTTKSEGGTGLGLSTVHGLVKQSGGYIELSSEPNKGTVVELFLPRSTGGQAIAKSPMPIGDNVGVPTETVLVVEDDQAVRRVAARRLTELGYRTLEVANAEAALEIIYSDRAVDLLFTDVVMPGGIDGMQLARIATQHRPDLRVLLTSGFPASSAAMETLDDRMPQLLMKPYRTSELAERVRRALHARP